MKRILTTLIISGFAQLCFSQADTIPGYLKSPEIPAFTIYKAPDSTAFTKEDLQNKKELIFIIFSPDCEHCQRETKELLANIDKFKKTQIVMISHLPYEEVRKFYSDYKISDYPEITMGRDNKFFFPIFFKVRNFPSIYVYDKKGKFKTSFEGSVAVTKIADAL